MEYTTKDKRLYLRLGDRVLHLFHEEWGEGSVVEERTSVVPGGTCLVRMLFECPRDLDMAPGVLALAVDAQNAPALKLYHRHGLRHVGVKLALMRQLRPRLAASAEAPARV